MIRGIKIIHKVAQFILGLVSSGYTFSQTAQFPDSVVMPASLEYKKTGLLTRVAVGNNYRREWQLPIKMPVLDITAEHGGLTITELGGGRQTKSLRMISSDGTEWVLRSVDKKVRKVLPRVVQRTLVEKFAQDMISASHPYSCLSVSVLAKNVGITGPNPQLFFVPDDTALGQYRDDFAGSVCFLEQRHPLRPNTKPESMEDLLEGLGKDNNKMIKQRELLKARLLDMVTGDWDRHQDQWRWGKYDSAGRSWYYPVPVDRDQAFFRPKGILVRIINSVATPYLKGFKLKMNGLYQLNKPARNFDKVFLNELQGTDWKEVINDLQSRLNDSILNLAVNALPVEIPAKRKHKLTRVLQCRRDDILKSAMKYYSRLSRYVYVFGSEEAELFEITETIDGLRLKIYKCTSPGLSCKIYDRTLDQKQTKRLYLVGVGNNDIINGEKTEKPAIKVITVREKNMQRHDLRSKILKRLKDKKREG